MLKSTKADSARYQDLGDERIAASGGLATVPLRQIAKIVPVWNDGQIVRRNGIRTITVMAEVGREINVMNATAKVQEKLSGLSLPEGVTLTYGGELEENEEQMPNIMAGLCIAVVIIFFILLWHFKRISTAVMMLMCLTLCLFGTAVGILIQGVDFGVTCVLGIVSLMGILVRNGIIMIDYAEELRNNGKNDGASGYLSFGTTAYAPDLPDIGSCFYGSHSDDIGRQRTVDADGNRYFLWHTDYNGVYSDCDAGMLLVDDERNNAETQSVCQTGIGIIK